MMTAERGERDAAPVAFAVPEVTEADIEAVAAVLRSGWITTGEQASGFEEDLSGFLGAGHVVAVSSCTAALEIALAHLRLPAGARVGVPAWTFASTALAAVHNGLQPVLLDVDLATLNLSADALDRAAADLSAVVPVHFGGSPVAGAVHTVAAAHGLPVVEDAAHALGASDERGAVGGPGTSPTCFSFYATKNLTSAEGGALVTDDDDLAAFARTYRLHGMDADAWARYRPDARGGYDIVEPGIKANLPDVLAALARSQLRRFDATQARRRELVERYRAGFTGSAVQVVPAVTDPGSADHLMVVLLPEGVSRDDVGAALRAAGIGWSIHFRPLHHFSWFREHAVVPTGALPSCDAAAERAMSLPLHVGLAEADVDRVTGIVREAVAA